MAKSVVSNPVTAFALLAALGLAACATSAPPYPPLPPLQAETRPMPPVSDQAVVWRPGDWQWTGSGYAWQPGRYEAAAGHGTNWLPGHWEGLPGVWVPGHWV